MGFPKSCKIMFEHFLKLICTDNSFKKACVSNMSTHCLTSDSLSQTLVVLVFEH